MHENSTPHEILRWAGTTFGDDLVVTASFGDAVLAHLANSVLPGVDIVLLDTGYLFAETEWYADDLRRRFGLNLRTVHPLPDVERDVWQTDTDACCAARKVEPLQRVLAGKRAWVTGLTPGRLAEPRHDASGARRPAPGGHQDQPDRYVDRRGRRHVHGDARAAGPSVDRPRLPVDRLLAVHATCHCRRSAGRKVGGNGQDRVRVARRRALRRSSTS